MKPAAAIDAGEDQVLYFRARRGHMAGPGAADPGKAACDILGAQAQQPGPGLLALAQRTKGRPTHQALKALLLGEKRALVRTWGQRETLHIYQPSDWSLIAAAREQWAPAGRRGPMPDAAMLDEALAILVGAGSGTRSDLIDLVPVRYVGALQKHMGKYIKSRDEARRFAAGRLLWCLSMRGDVCVADKVGTEQAYAPRVSWFPRLAWPKPSALDAAVELTRRYLRLYGPASAKDVAHHFGARVREASAWLEVLRVAGELADVRCGSRKGLLLMTDDASAVQEKPPKGSAWPIRLLPQWDTYLMGHADKSWTVPDEAARKLVWRGQAVVAAAVLDRGRVIAEWLRQERKDALDIGIVPLPGWTKKHLPAVQREAEAIAAHLGLSGSRVAMA